MIKIVFTILAALDLFLLFKKVLDRKIFIRERHLLKKDLMRFQWLLKVTNELLYLSISQKHWYQPLVEKGSKSIAIYGMGELGMRLSEDLILNGSIEFLYGLDINAHAISYVRPVYKLDEIHDLPKPDIIVLTTYCTTDNLKNLIVNETGCEVMCIEEIVNAIR